MTLPSGPSFAASFKRTTPAVHRRKNDRKRSSSLPSRVGRDADIPRRRVAAAPRPRRGYSAEASRSAIRSRGDARPRTCRILPVSENPSRRTYPRRTAAASRPETFRGRKRSSSLRVWSPTGLGRPVAADVSTSSPRRPPRPVPPGRPARPPGRAQVPKHPGPRHLGAHGAHRRALAAGGESAGGGREERRRAPRKSGRDGGRGLRGRRRRRQRGRSRRRGAAARRGCTETVRERRVLLFIDERRAPRPSGDGFYWSWRCDASSRARRQHSNAAKPNRKWSFVSRRTRARAGTGRPRGNLVRCS